MIKTVPFLSIAMLGVALSTGCAVEADDEALSEDAPLEEVEQELKGSYCGVSKAEASAAQRSATALNIFINAGRTAGTGAVATPKPQGAFWNPGATTFYDFYPYGPNTMDAVKARKTMNLKAQALKALIDNNQLVVGGVAPGSICNLQSGIRGYYASPTVGAQALAYLRDFVQAAVDAGHDSRLGYFLYGAGEGTEPPTPSGGTGGTGGGGCIPNPIGGGCLPGGGLPIGFSIRPAIIIDPEPAKLNYGLYGNGSTGAATYVNNNTSIYSAWQWPDSWSAGGYAPPQVGAPCANVSVSANTTIYQSIQQKASDGSYRCR